MIRSVLRLVPRDALEVLRLYADRRVLDRAIAQPGCRSVDIGIVQAERAVICITAEWDSAEDYHRWSANDSRAADVDHLAPLLGEAIQPATLIEISERRTRDDLTVSPNVHTDRREA